MNQLSMDLKKVVEGILGRNLLVKEGIDELAIQKIELKLGIQLPKVLKDFYALIGNIPLFVEGHHYFLDLEELLVKDEKLVFLAENQQMLHWAVDLSGTTTVYQTTDTIQGTDLIWYEEAFDLERFLEMMLYVQCMYADEVYHTTLEGGYTYFAYLEAANLEDDTLSLLLANLEKQWQNVVKGNDVSVFLYATSMLLYFINDEEILDKTSLIWLCTKDQRLFDRWIDTYGFMEL